MIADNDHLTILNPRNEPEVVLGHISADRILSIVEEAENGDTRNLFALYRDIISSDSHVLAELMKRKGAVLSDSVTLLPWDKNSPEDRLAMEACYPLIDSEPFQRLTNHLLNATVYPVSVAEKVFRFNRHSGLYTLDDIIPVNYALLDYRTGQLRIRDTDESGAPTGESFPLDLGRYIVHRGIAMPVPDSFGGPMRSVLFWWLLRSMSRQWWADFLERFGVPFMKGTYRSGDREGRQVLTSAFQQACRLGAIVVSDTTTAEIIDTTTSDTSGSHERFIEICNREISRVILGQTLSGNVQSTGELGGGQASLQSAVRDDVRAMDAKLLSTTIAKQLFSQVLSLNGLSGHPPVIVFGAESDRDLSRTVQLIRALAQAGLEPDDEGLTSISERIGFGLRRRSPSAALPATFSAKSTAKRTSPFLDALTRYDQKINGLILSAQSPQEAVSAVERFVGEEGIQLLEPDIRTILELFFSAGYNGGDLESLI